jgi:hypothetical protein
MKLREFFACAAILIAGALATVALFAFAAVWMNRDDGAATAATKPACATQTITVWVDDPTPCDVTPDQELDVAGLSFGSDQPWLVCDDMGGQWIGDGVDLCKDVDK